ncbi:MAG TPA: hypothetical protein EYH34_14860 [Planctomycetes bacterium]|nr:hypothetical protein [Planctomycetota bacterium]
MTRVRINITSGTAGRIDHGKTPSVRLLTGCDTDRLKAEQERGTSIDLGFAPCAWYAATLELPPGEPRTFRAARG